MRLKASVALLSLLTIPSYAYSPYANNACDSGFTPNVFLGAQVGYGIPDYGGKIKDTFNQYPTHSFDEDGLAGRVHVGYQFTPPFGIEAGYTVFSDNTYKAYSNNTAMKEKLKTDAVDLLAVLRLPYMPFGNEGPVLSLKGGAAYVMSRAESYSSGPSGAFSASSTHNRWEPEAGVSLGYTIENTNYIDLSYQHVFGSRNLNSPKIDLVSLGFTHKFA